MNRINLETEENNNKNIQIRNKETKMNLLCIGSFYVNKMED